MSAPTSGQPSLDATSNLGDTEKLATMFDNDVNEAEDPAIASGAAVKEAPAPELETPATETKTETEEPAPEDPPVEEVPVDDEPVDGEPAASGATQAATTRDYSGLDENEKKIFKNMSRAAYDALFPKWQRLKEADALNARLAEATKALEATKDMQFWQHESAHRLSPEYATALSKVKNMRLAADHWRQALVDIENGKEIHDIVYDDKGNPSLSENTFPATAETKAQVMSLLAESQSNINNAATELRGVQSTFSGKYKQFEERLSQAETALLTEPRKHEAFRKQEENVLKHFPEEVRHMRTYRLLAGAYAMIDNLAKLNNQLKAQLDGKGVKQNLARKQGPGVGRAANGGGNSPKVDSNKFVTSLLDHVRGG